MGQITKSQTRRMAGFFFPESAPMEIRTPVLTLKGSRPRPLDDGGGCLAQMTNFPVTQPRDFIIRGNTGQAVPEAGAFAL
jgi:hypothetical protein